MLWGDGVKVKHWWRDLVDSNSNEVMLIRNNQFGLDGPQAGDLGVSVRTYRLPNMDTLWHTVIFDSFFNQEWSVPDAALQVLNDREE